MRRLGFAVFLLLAQSAHAQTNFSIYTSASCGDFVSVASNEMVAGMTAQYVRGYLSAYNVYAKRNQITAELSNSTIRLYVEKFCRENPLMGVHNAAAFLALELSGAMKPKNQ